MRKLAALIVLALITKGAVAQIGISAKEFLQIYENVDAGQRVVALNVLLYTKDGIDWANAYLTTQRKVTPTYCSPTDLKLLPDQLVDLIKGTLQKVPQISSQPVGAVLLISLQLNFPCPGQEINK